jgi:hypothetical protein
MRRDLSVVASDGVSTVAEVTPPALKESGPGPSRPGLTIARRVGVVALLAAALIAIAFVAGGVDETFATPGNTWTEIALTLLGVITATAALLVAGPGGRRYGWVTVGLMAAMFALEAASTIWSVVPGSSWLASGQMLAYLAVFAAAAAVARVLPERWTVLLTALLVATVAVSAWSLLAKVFPSALAAGNSGPGSVGRLQAPFGYWNALALAAAMGVPGCLWLGAQRGHSRRLAALSVPALSLLVAVLVLSSSRSADLAACIAAGVWLALVPLRLRAAAVLLVGAAGGAVISAWGLAHRGISGDGVALSLQNHDGHIFGVVILVVLVATTVTGISITDSMDHATVPAQMRSRIGAALLGLLSLLVVAAIVGVAASPRGLTGEISHGWQKLTDPQATVSATSASRVFKFGSSRPLYWHQALAVGDHAVLKGVGELGFSVAYLRYTTEPEIVLQAHSYVFETYADLGILGLAVTGALLLAWVAATTRTIDARLRWRDLAPAPSAERVGMITLAAIVIGFGVQSTLDWTWYFAGVAIPALLAAGWLAGRGPLLEVGTSAVAEGPPRRHPRVALLERPGELGLVVVVLAATLLGCWLVWRPLHSADLVNAAESTGSIAEAQAAQRADPLSLSPYQLLSNFELQLHRPASAAAELIRGVDTQPDNPYAWSALGAFYIQRREWKRAIPPLHEVQVLDISTDPLTVQNNAAIRQASSHINGS